MSTTCHRNVENVRSLGEGTLDLYLLFRRLTTSERILAAAERLEIQAHFFTFVDLQQRHEGET